MDLMCVCVFLKWLSINNYTFHIFFSNYLEKHEKCKNTSILG